MSGQIIKPIFVFGCCNSGTTILWQALKQHQKLSGPSIEGQDLKGLPDSMRHYLGKSTFRLWAHSMFEGEYYRTENDYSKAEKEQLESVYAQNLTEGTRLITKSPADTMRARLIQAYFPDAYFIAITRNGYCVSEGIVRKRKSDPERPQYEGLFTTIDQAAEQWSRANTYLLSHQTHLRQYRIIKYEDLVADPKQTLDSLLDFIGLEKEGFQVPIFDVGLNNQQIARLSEYEKKTITQIAHPMLVHFGYGILDGGLRW